MELEKIFEIRQGGEIVAEFKTLIMAETYTLTFGGHIWKSERMIE
jgi:hypothetical protein